MTKRFLPGKGLWIWVCVSALLIIAGIVVGALFGFNYAKDYKTVEITYDTGVVIEGKDETLAEKCEEIFSAAGLDYTSKSVDAELDTNYVAEDGNYTLRYVFASSVSDEALRNAVTSIRALDIGADLSVTFHSLEGQRFTEASWRAAVALGVAAIVALVYVGFRFGWDSALAGLVACANDALVALAILVLARIPVQAFAPVLYAGIAVMLSALLWGMQCMKLRESFKDPANAGLPPQEAVGSAIRSGAGRMLAVIIPLVWLFVILGVIAAGGMRIFMLCALIPLAVSVYSSFLLAPAVYVPLKSKFDVIRSNRKRYIGKKKAEAQE